MADQGLPPPPINDQPGSFTWLEWYRQLRNYISTNGSVPWYVINFAGSKLTDIADRPHDATQSIQGGTAGEHYHINLDQYGAISTSLELLNTSTTLTLPTTPTVFVMPTVQTSNGITYNTTTGEFVFTHGGTYMFTCMLNATASGARILYFYADIDTGSGYATRRYSARSTRLLATTQEQTLVSSTNYWPKGSKLKLYIWASSATVTLDSTDVPGTTPGTVTVPAARIMFAGGL